MKYRGNKRRERNKTVTSNREGKRSSTPVGKIDGVPEMML